MTGIFKFRLKYFFHFNGQKIWFKLIKHFIQTLMFSIFNQKSDFQLCIETYFSKVENIWKGSLDLISSPSPSVKIQIIGGKVKWCWALSTNFLYSEVCWQHPQQCFAFTPFPPTIWIFTEGDGIKSRLSSYTFFALWKYAW